MARHYWKADGYSTPAWWTMLPNSNGQACLVIRRSDGWHAGALGTAYATRDDAVSAYVARGRYRRAPASREAAREHVRRKRAASAPRSAKRRR